MKSRPLTLRDCASARRVGKITIPRWLTDPVCMSSRTKPWPSTALAKAASAADARVSVPITDAGPLPARPAISIACRLGGKSSDSYAHDRRSRRAILTLAIASGDRSEKPRAARTNFRESVRGTFLTYLVGCFLYLPYSNSSANSTHLNSRICAFFSARLYSGRLIFQGLVNTLASSMVAS